MSKVEDYAWLETQTSAWVQGALMFPVRVDILHVDWQLKEAVIKTTFQEGVIQFNKLYKSQSKCPCR